MYIRRIVGNSMNPSFHAGDIVVFVPFKSYYPNNVIMANVDGKEIIKRIARIEGDGVYLLGDNLTQSTDSRDYGLVHISQIQGRLCLCLPISKIIAKRQ